MKNIKASIREELEKKKGRWDDKLRGVIMEYRNVKILNNGEGRVMDDFPHVHFSVKYDVTYSQPKLNEIYCNISDSITLSLEARIIDI